MLKMGSAQIATKFKPRVLKGRITLIARLYATCTSPRVIQGVAPHLASVPQVARQWAGAELLRKPDQKRLQERAWGRHLKHTSMSAHILLAFAHGVVQHDSACKSSERVHFFATNCAMHHPSTLVSMHRHKMTAIAIEKK